MLSRVVLGRIGRDTPGVYNLALVSFLSLPVAAEGTDSVMETESGAAYRRYE